VVASGGNPEPARWRVNRETDRRHELAASTDPIDQRDISQRSSWQGSSLKFATEAS
jgi:hypothetical protein